MYIKIYFFQVLQSSADFVEFAKTLSVFRVGALLVFVVLIKYQLQMPFMLSSLVGRSVGISLPAGPLLKALLETLLVPVLIGKVRTPWMRHALVSSELNELYLY